MDPMLELILAVLAIVPSLFVFLFLYEVVDDVFCNELFAFYPAGAVAFALWLFLVYLIP